MVDSLIRLWQNNSSKKKLIILALLAWTALKIFLISLNSHGNSEPLFLNLLENIFSSDEILAGQRLYREGVPFTILYHISLFFFFSALLIYNLHERILSVVTSQKRNGALYFFLSLFIVLSLLLIIKIPFALFGGYFRYFRYGLVHVDPLTWLLRFIASGWLDVLAISLSGVLIRAVYLKVKKPIIWMPILFMCIAFSFVLFRQYIATPLFYDFSSLEKGQLREKINECAVKAGVNLDDIRIIHTDKYSSFANAYLTGFGSTRRIYIYDTLLKDFTDSEIKSIVGHELGHYVEEHIISGVCLGSIGIFVALPLISWLCGLFFITDINYLARHGRISEILFLILLVIFISKPIQNSISRYMETRADRFSLMLTGDPASFISLERKIAINNRAYLLPHPLYACFYHTHPSVVERICLAQKILKKMKLSK